MLITFPTKCPSCDSTLELVNAQLFCKNQNCTAQSSKILEGFCKKMKIKGFGERTLDKLKITTISELYQLTEQDLVMSLGDKIGSKLYGEIGKSKSCSFEDFIKSLGINLIGGSAAPKVVAAFPTPFSEVSYTDLRKEGLGDKSAIAFLDYLKSDRGWEEMDIADSLFTFQVKQSVPVSKTESGSDYPELEICITGKLKDYKSRSAVTEVLSPLNITVKGSVTKNVQYLICEDDTKTSSSSYKKALSKNIPIITITDLLKIVG